ncbi:unnamed protein product [Calicophoron daubneyi]|uniref:Zinc finger CCHC domain-containing protein 10 n=1 Tax=Calicophoron daubneyi TaxID=300641 RepID=A0AAV2TAP7_CALDB
MSNLNRPRLPIVPRNKVDQSTVTCQKCLEKGHWTYQCNRKRKYLERESYTSRLGKKIENAERKKLERKQARRNSSSGDGSSSSSSSSTSEEDSSTSEEDASENSTDETTTGSDTSSSGSSSSDESCSQSSSVSDDHPKSKGKHKRNS